MFWYRVFNEDNYQDFNTFAKAKSYYDSLLKESRKHWEEMGFSPEEWEEDKKLLDFSIVKMETILTPAD